MDNDIKEIIKIQNRLKRKLSDTRYAHTVSVSHTCACLAMKYEYDVNKAIVAGLATPLAIIVSEGLCATNGILIKKSEILENAQKTNTVIFDKTGTLTYGKLKISEIKNYSNIEKNELLQIVGSIESKSTHPIGKAFVDYLEDNKIPFLEVKEFENVAGYGIIGKVNNKKIIIGNSKILEIYDIKNKYEQDERNLASKGNSIVYVIQDEKVVALIGVNDIVRKEAKDVIKKLSDMKIETIMLTGDNKETANKIANELGITKVIANVLPKEKSNTIKELKQKNKFAKDSQHYMHTTL